MGKIILISIVSLFLLLKTHTHADIYKYVDPNGVIHFTNVQKGKNYRKVMTENKTGQKKNYDQIINNKSIKYNIEPSLIKALITVESNWDPRAISNKGALGLMQLMPATAREMNINNPFDPEQNIEGGTKYLRYLLNKFNGDINLSLAAYNAGPSKVEEIGDIPAIMETKKFVRNVILISSGSKSKKPTRIYKIIYEDGTTLYTNNPSIYNKYKLSNF